MLEFNNTTSKDGIIQHIEGLLGLSDGTISGNASFLKIMTGFVNTAFEVVVGMIIAAQPDWEFDDFNYTDFPIGTTDLEDEVKDYQLPAASQSSSLATNLKLIQVSVRDKNGVLKKLKNIDEANFDRNLDEVFPTPGLPQYYRLNGMSLELYPTPSADEVTIDEGLEVQFQRSGSPFVSTDTTKKPGIISVAHGLIPLIASQKYGGPRGLGKQSDIKEQIKFESELVQVHYSNMNRDVRRRATRRYQLGN